MKEIVTNGDEQKSKGIRPEDVLSLLNKNQEKVKE
jgi:hypothetical protein